MKGSKIILPKPDTPLYPMGAPARLREDPGFALISRRLFPHETGDARAGGTSSENWVFM